TLRRILLLPAPPRRMLRRPRYRPAWWRPRPEEPPSICHGRHRRTTSASPAISSSATAREWETRSLQVFPIPECPAQPPTATPWPHAMRRATLRRILLLPAPPRRMLRRPRHRP